MATSEKQLATKPPKEIPLDSFIPTSYLALLEGTLLTNGDLKVRTRTHTYISEVTGSHGCRWVVSSVTMCFVPTSVRELLFCRGRIGCLFTAT